MRPLVQIDYRPSKIVKTYHATHHRPHQGARTRPAVTTYHQSHHRPLIDYRSPAPQPQRTGRIASNRYELYQYHKANGTLHEFYRMFGIDWRHQ